MKQAFTHLKPEIIIAFLLGIAILFLFSWRQRSNNVSGYSLKKYLKPSLPNILFHLVSSFALLFVLHEISEDIIKRLGFNENKYHLTLACLTGMFGGLFVAWVFEKAAKIRNKNDDNIKHIHGPDCKH
ncbi:hypothetical protein [Lacinutrix sp. Hel_I_90]|uniref:hypothetical protein n=1 Tax=Lacinutrix sp. Hel_I_90 TaxID=1249999 RepID=UPI0005C872B7|nr:hypothetical protein [Lacinutrix sp. Hel_I_90]